MKSIWSRSTSSASPPPLRAGEDLFLGEALIVGQRGVRLRDVVVELVIRGEVLGLVRDDAVDDLAVRGLDEAERVDPGVGRERTDETDVRTLGGLDRAHAAVVRRVDVSDLHRRAVAREAAGSQRREAALVGQTRERVVLIHELRQLRGSEELLDRGDDGTDVDERLRRDRLDVLGGHALAHDALHAGEARADLVLDELADGADAAVAEVIDVVELDAHLDLLAVALTLRRLDSGVEGDEVADGRGDVVDREHRVRQRGIDAELPVDLVAADLGQVVALGVEVEVVEQVARSLGGRGLGGTQLLVDVEQRLLLRGDGVLRQGLADRLELAELLEDLRLGPAEGLEQHGDRLLALAVEADATWSRLSTSNSSHAPREGMIFAEKMSLSVVLSTLDSK